MKVQIAKFMWISRGCLKLVLNLIRSYIMEFSFLQKTSLTMDFKEKDVLIFYVNGRKITEPNVDPEENLLTYLRKKLQYTGTKFGCGEGSCGACTVMISQYNRRLQQIEHYAVTSCLISLCYVHGKAVTTVEGIGSSQTSLHPIQERIAKCNGSQCGYCTPGIVMSSYALLKNNPEPVFEDIKKALQGNICRCTGYRPILTGIETFSHESCCRRGKSCCKNKQESLSRNEDGMTTKLCNESEFMPYHPSQDPIFPPELQLSDSLNKKIAKFIGPRVTWIRPVTLSEFLQLKKTYPSAHLIFGNTYLQLNKYSPDKKHMIVIAPGMIPEFITHEVTNTGLKVGAGVTINELQNIFRHHISKLQGYQTAIFEGMEKHLNLFGNQQIRNVVACGSCIAAPIPGSDFLLLLLASKASVELISLDGEKKTMKLLDILSTMENGTLKHQTILSILIPFSKEQGYFLSYKEMKRRANDSAIINAAFNITFLPNSNKINSIAIVYGNLAKNIIFAENTMKYLTTKNFTEAVLSEAVASLNKDISSFGSKSFLSDYKIALVFSLFHKFKVTIFHKLYKSGILSTNISTREMSVLNSLPEKSYEHTYCFEEIEKDQSKFDSVTHPVIHASAICQATGEAEYTDDILPFEGQLYLALVTSHRSHAEIISVDPTEALKIPGVVSYIDHTDIPGENAMGAYLDDEEIFATKKVVFKGQAIAAIVAETDTIASKAAKLVQVQYKDLKPIITIEEAIEAKSYLNSPLIIEQGDIEKGFKSSDHIIEDEVKVHGQKHFYIELPAAIALPKKEHDELTMYFTTQDPTRVQHLIGKALNIPFNKIVIKVIRLGAGYGGKISLPNMMGLPVAIAAKKLNRPVRYRLSRREDMVMLGGRNPYLFKYKVGVSNSGRLLALEISMYSDGGYSADFSVGVLDVAIRKACDAYVLPNVKVTGYCLKTNLPTNTAFRGFGSPQANFWVESMMNKIAITLNMSQKQIREINIPPEGYLTYFNQKLSPNSLDRCWLGCLEKSNFDQRRKETENFNKDNRWNKRGIAITPYTYGIVSSQFPFNYASALIHINVDGSVIMSHGGTEMGQGLHTKMLQIASRCLNLPISYLHISETSTDKVANAHLTSASVNTDINGLAVKNACEILLERLKPYMEKKPTADWKEWVNDAFLDRINLSAIGYFKMTDIPYMMNVANGADFYYYIIYAAACCEVEIDCLTGEHRILQTDIVIDVGKSINPAIDIGQVEGGFVQGIGMMTTEDWKISETGEIITNSARTYRVPSSGDIPIKLNIHFLKDSPADKGLYSSKGLGEVGVCFGITVAMAIKDAIYSAREDEGLKGDLRLDCPITIENIRKACSDGFTNVK